MYLSSFFFCFAVRDLRNFTSGSSSSDSTMYYKTNPWVMPDRIIVNSKTLLLPSKSTIWQVLIRQIENYQYIWKVSVNYISASSIICTGLWGMHMHVIIMRYCKPVWAIIHTSLGLPGSTAFPITERFSASPSSFIPSTNFDGAVPAVDIEYAYIYMPIVFHRCTLFVLTTRYLHVWHYNYYIKCLYSSTRPEDM